jgi:hypothetical protein
MQQNECRASAPVRCVIQNLDFFIKLLVVPTLPDNVSAWAPEGRFTPRENYSVVYRISSRRIR